MSEGAVEGDKYNDSISVIIIIILKMTMIMIMIMIVLIGACEGIGDGVEVLEGGGASRIRSL